MKAYEYLWKKGVYRGREYFFEKQRGVFI